MGEDDSILPSGEAVVSAVRKLWHEATIAPCVLEKDWYVQMKAKSVAPALVPSEPQWPLLPRSGLEDQTVEGDQGNNLGYMLRLVGICKCSDRDG